MFYMVIKMLLYYTEIRENFQIGAILITTQFKKQNQDLKILCLL